MVDALFYCLLACIIYIIGVVIICIKDKRNIFEGIYEFFGEWLDIVKRVWPIVLIFLILALLGFAWFN